MQLSYRGNKYEVNQPVPQKESAKSDRYPSTQLYAALRYRGTSYLRLVIE